jgi:hypothetical protein
VWSLLSGQGIPPFMRISMQQIPNEYASICQVRLLEPTITSDACQRSAPSTGGGQMGVCAEGGRNVRGRGVPLSWYASLFISLCQKSQST